MKYKNNILKMTAMAFIATICGACTEELKYTPEQVPANDQVYFDKSLADKIDLNKNETSFTVQISRIKADAAATVNITATEVPETYTIPSSVSFKAGETVASLPIAYTPEAIDFEEYVNITLNVGDEAYTTPYGNSSYTFSVGIPAPYTSLGKATYTDGYFGTTFQGFSICTYEVEIQRSDLNHGIYRLVNPYGPAFPYSNSDAYDSTKDYYLTIDATDPNGVFIPLQDTGLQLTNEGTVWVYSYAAYFLDNGKTLTDAKKAGICGTLKDGVITFPIQSLLFCFGGTGSLYYANTEGEFMVAMPGIEVHDYEVYMEYTGQFTDVKGKKYATTNIELGSELDYAKFAVVADNGGELEAQLDAIADGIIDGSVKSTVVNESGTVQLPFKGNGRFYLVGVGFANEEAQYAAYLEFVVKGSDEPVGEITPIESYEGYWIVNGEYSDKNGNTQTVNVPVTMTQDVGSNGEEEFPIIIMSGLMGFEGYNSDVFMKYDGETGNLQLLRHQCDDFTDNSGTAYQIMFYPMMINGDEVTLYNGTDEIFGNLNKTGDIVFTNSEYNKAQYNTFGYIIYNDGNPQIFSPLYELTINPDADEATATTAQAKITNFKVISMSRAAGNAETIKKVTRKAENAQSVNGKLHFRNCSKRITPKFMGTASGMNINK